MPVVTLQRSEPLRFSPEADPRAVVALGTAKHVFIDDLGEEFVREMREEIRERVRSVTGMNCVIELIPPRTLPRTSSGKLSRTKARNLYLAGEIKPYELRAA